MKFLRGFDLERNARAGRQNLHILPVSKNPLGKTWWAGQRKRHWNRKQEGKGASPHLNFFSTLVIGCQSSVVTP
jgi:hypothetical protein